MNSEKFEYLNRRESNARTYSRNVQRVLNWGSLAQVRDDEGRHYIDCLACAGALPLGHNHPFVQRQVIDFLQSGQLQQALDLATPAKLRFMEALFAILPENLAAQAKVQFCGPSGADAVEAALKLFKTATGRRPVVVFQGAYHGMTHATLGMMGNLAPKQAISGMPAEVHFLPYPYTYRSPFGAQVDARETERLSLACLENLLSDPESGVNKPAMLLVEPIQGEGGCIPASDEWLRGVREITARHGVPMVLDEVQSGIGRSGDMFAFERAGILPDAVLLSKAIGGGYPLSLLVYREEYDRWQPGAHAGTFRGNQIALVSGAATLEFMRQENLLEQVRRKGERLRQGLLDLQRRFRCIGDVRGRGLMLGMELIEPDGPRDALGHLPAAGDLARAIKKSCLNEGLIIESGGRQGAVLRFLPPLVITDAEIDAVVERLGNAIACHQPALRAVSRVAAGEMPA
ncbi:diaminobutyrate--2-oxoglutarate transaminase family protein [Pseudomonas sp. RIT-PI-AD]|uniref:diaminobutyrate--2-oxoglutarate transaminase family protein n=1 Tax=Pseudomonas sp. RIT-PI-AD TaxID=3035294 RepID=UPI0021D862CE|nr:diaminobutyrate--2-oxoglutarate transaminase family protein [Pseudomonas sp. RIT-PI-AD]